MRILLALVLCAASAFGQSATRWKATTGDVSVSAAYAATIQIPSTSSSQIYIDQIIVYASAAASASQAANGTAATATAGTVSPILPTPLNVLPPVNFFTASNVGTGTDQAGILHIPAGGTVVICLSPSCGAPAQVILGPGSGTGSNYTLSFASVTATVNVTFLGRTMD
jgi:hypothetical protein